MEERKMKSQLEDLWTLFLILLFVVGMVSIGVYSWYLDAKEQNIFCETEGYKYATDKGTDDAGTLKIECDHEKIFTVKKVEICEERDKFNKCEQSKTIYVKR